ncbi:MAG: hypothetical protein GYB64_12210 [Chloroflexi bacterium]|nr:hypothetical protein [Chloroflexota bacterium]
MNKLNDLPIVPIVIAGVLILAGCGLVGGVAALTLGVFRQTAPVSEPTVSLAEVEPTAQATATALFEPTFTPLPATDTPEATATPEVTEEPTATTEPTSAPAPVQTSAAPPPTDPPAPTATSPPETGPLGQISFSLQRTSIQPGEQVIFNFSVTNITRDTLPFGFLGATVLNAEGANVNFQPSWTEHSLEEDETLTHQDNIKPGVLTEPGTYTVYLTVCYSPADECQVGGEWVFLSGPVELTVIQP